MIEILWKDEYNKCTLKYKDKQYDYSCYVVCVHLITVYITDDPFKISYFIPHRNILYHWSVYSVTKKLHKYELVIEMAKYNIGKKWPMRCVGYTGPKLMIEYEWLAESCTGSKCVPTIPTSLKLLTEQPDLTWPDLSGMRGCRGRGQQGHCVFSESLCYIYKNFLSNKELYQKN